MKEGPYCRKGLYGKVFVQIVSIVCIVTIIVKFHQNCENQSDLSNLVWFGMALYCLVEILKLYVSSGRLSTGLGRLCAGSGSLSGWVGLKSGGWVGQMGG